MREPTAPNFTCLVLLLLAAMLFCGLAIGATDSYEENYHDARLQHYEQCSLCW